MRWPKTKHAIHISYCSTHLEFHPKSAVTEALHHISNQGEAAADVEIAGAIHDRRANPAARAGNAAHADPVGIAEGRVNAHGIHRLRIIYENEQRAGALSLSHPMGEGQG